LTYHLEEKQKVARVSHLVNANGAAKYEAVPTFYGNELTGVGISSNIWGFETEEVVTRYNLRIRNYSSPDLLQFSIRPN